MTESDVFSMVEDVVNRVLKEDASQVDFNAEFKKNLFLANKYLYLALSFIDDKAVKRAFNIVNERCYELENENKINDGI